MIMKALSNIWTQSAKHFWTKDKKHLKLCFDWIWPENWISNGEEVKLKRPELAGGDDSNLLDANVENVEKENKKNYSIMIGYDRHPLRRKERLSKNSCLKILLKGWKLAVAFVGKN